MKFENIDNFLATTYDAISSNIQNAEDCKKLTEFLTRLDTFVKEEGLRSFREDAEKLKTALKAFATKYPYAQAFISLGPYGYDEDLVDILHYIDSLSFEP